MMNLDHPDQTGRRRPRRDRHGRLHARAPVETGRAGNTPTAPSTTRIYPGTGNGNVDGGNIGLGPPGLGTGFRRQRRRPHLFRPRQLSGPLRGLSRVWTPRRQWLARYPQVTVRIEGNADERGTREYNLALGARRAESVRNYLVERGVSAGRIDTISYGKERPIAAGSTEDSLGPQPQRPHRHRLRRAVG